MLRGRLARSHLAEWRSSSFSAEALESILLYRFKMARARKYNLISRISRREIRRGSKIRVATRTDKRTVGGKGWPRLVSATARWARKNFFALRSALFVRLCPNLVRAKISGILFAHASLIRRGSRIVGPRYKTNYPQYNFI